MSRKVPIDKQMAADRRTAWLLLGLLIVGFWASLYVLFGFRIALLIGMMAVPAVGYALSRLLVFNVAPAIMYWLRWLQWNKVNGCYHAFDDRPVRVEWGGKECRVAAADVYAVLYELFDEPARRRLRLRFDAAAFFEEGGIWWFGEQAALDVLTTRSERLDQRTNRFRNWLLRETFPSLRRKAEL